MNPISTSARFLVVLLLVAAPAGVYAQAIATSTPTVLEYPELIQRYQETITADELAAHLYFFASDLFEGRETTTRGQKLGAHYLAAQYRRMGLTPAGTAVVEDLRAPEAYFQPFDVFGMRVEEARLLVQVPGKEDRSMFFGPERQNDHAYLSFGTETESEGSVVFAGYGIADDALGYDDYRAIRNTGIDVTGKWLLILRDEPMKNDSTSLLPTPDGRPTNWSRSVFPKIRGAYSAGRPAGILIVGDVGPLANVSFAEQAGRAAAGLNRVGSLSLTEMGNGRSYPPVYTISSDLANHLIAGSGRTVIEIKDEIDASLRPVVFEVPAAKVASRLQYGSYRAETENVLAVIEGSDPDLKDEVVVITSHYDHVGMDPTLEGDQIFNGADDDGSGTVAILEIAEAFAIARADGYGPRRTILFLNVTAEEKGLLGSAYYADVEPVFPIDRTVTNINLDMIGRHDPTHPGDNPDYVYIIGSNLISQELHDLNVRVNEVTEIGIELNERFNSRDDPNRFYARSDHWNFGKHGVPFIFFFTGTHEDYHQPGDEAHKIDYERAARIARLVFATAWQVANQDERPAVSGTGFN